MTRETKDRIKRISDIVIASLALTILFPVALATAGTVRVRLGSPVLFKQVRPGRGEQPFTLLKFRTMTQERDRSGDLLPDAERMTRVGRWLRAGSLDELPELLNVLRGDMSIVGPRPLLVRYLDRYTPEQARRHEVRPGITGLAVVNGRNALTWEQKLAMDVWYVDHRSLRLDAQIMVRTIGIVLRRAGVQAPGSATAEEFTGSEG
jgi:sugar transferase EpsL